MLVATWIQWPPLYNSHFFLSGDSLNIHFYLILPTIGPSQQQQLPAKCKIAPGQCPVNDWQTVDTKPRFLPAQGQQTYSVPCIVGLCFWWVSILLIHFDLYFITEKPQCPLRSSPCLPIMFTFLFSQGGRWVEVQLYTYFCAQGSTEIWNTSRCLFI